MYPISSDGIHQKKVTSAKFFITIPKFFVDGRIIKRSPITFKFLMIDNPRITTLVIFNDVNRNVLSSVAVTLINSLNGTRLILTNKNIMSPSDTELISIDGSYLDLSLANIGAIDDDFLGKLTGQINFIDPKC